MAFCTGCGARMDDNAKFCTSCGAQVSAAGAPSQASSPGPAAAVAPSPVPPTRVAGPSQPPAPTQGGSGALKVVLIVLGVIVLLGIMVVGMISYGVYRARKAIINESGAGGTTLTLPGVKINGGAGASAEKVAADLGIEVYPGAVGRKNSAGSVNIGGVTVGGAEFETSDPVSNVVEYYRGKYPNSTIESSDENHQSIVLNSEKGFVAIEVRATGGQTRISISRMAGNSKQ